MYVKNGIHLEKVLFGAGQENGRRPGTGNVMGIVGLGTACAIAKRDFDKNIAHLSSLRNRLYYGLQENLRDKVRINGDLDFNLPNTLNLSFRDIIANDLVVALGDKVVVSAGAACHSGISKISAVQQAMHIPEVWAKGAIRFSVGKFTTADEIDQAIRSITQTYTEMAKT